MLPTPTRHLQIQIQQIADASNPRIGIYKSNSSKLQMLPNPGYVSANPIPANCRYFRPPTRHLQIQIQQVADTSEPRTGICKFNTSKLQMLPTPTRHLQIQIQQVADTSNPDQASANPIPANCRYFHIRNSPLYVSANPNPANCRCFQPRSGICKSKSSKLQMLPTPTRHLQVQYQQIADASEPRIGIYKSKSSKLQILPIPGQASANPIPASCRYFRTRPGIYKSNTSKLQILPTPGYVSTNPILASCRCFRP